MARLTSFTDDAKIAFDNLSDAALNLFAPPLRLGVTGLSRAGKTVFITSLVQNLMHGSDRLATFEPVAAGRVAASRLEPQPSMDLPRFQFEDHLSAIADERRWPTSTRSISELRLTIAYESASAWNRALGPGQLHIDIVDYPGEWILDLPLLAMSYEQWCAQAIALSRLPNREKLSAPWREALARADAQADQDEAVARELADRFTDYLRACRQDSHALSTLPPGRFLMPGDLEGSPALTFSPLLLEPDAAARRDSLHYMMASRYEAYKSVVVKPFFRQHFARLDRQIVLVDLLAAINAGPDALADLQTALGDILSCFRPGRSSWLGSLVRRRIDRILFAATKADHLHHANHDRLEAILRALVETAMREAKFAGARVDVSALAAVRATREMVVRDGGEELQMIAGTPIAGETIADDVFDGETETAIFPGDLPADPRQLLTVGKAGGQRFPQLRFVRFRPPQIEAHGDGVTLSLPHIRLDRAMQFLLADRLA